MQLAQEFEKANAGLHDLKAFDCGKSSMNEFLARYSIKHHKIGISSTWVLPLNNSGNTQKTIAAYYTLAASTVGREEIPVERSLPRYPISVALLARLAIDQLFQGKGLGQKVLVYALRHSVRLCDAGLPAMGLVLDVLDDDALSFYQRFEIFKPFTDNPMRLFVPMETLRSL